MALSLLQLHQLCRMYFDKMLRQSGLFDQLEQMGIQDGHIVSMYDLEFEYQR